MRARESMKLELYSPEALFLCARIYALWNVYYSLATFNCWSFCLSKGMDCVWELKALCIAHTNSSSSSRSSSGTYRKWNAQIVRHGNFHDDTQWHSKNARNYFWLMHSIILFDSLILSFLHSFAFSRSRLFLRVTGTAVSFYLVRDYRPQWIHLS